MNFITRQLLFRGGMPGRKYLLMLVQPRTVFTPSVEWEEGVEWEPGVEWESETTVELVETIGLSGATFAGTWPEVTMSVPADDPLIGIGFIAAAGDYYIPDYANNTDNQFFWGEGRGIAVYDTAQTDTVAKKILAYFKEPWWPNSLVLANDVLTEINNRGAELEADYVAPVTDGLGGLTSGTPLHSDGLWCGPAYTNLIPSGGDDIRTWAKVGSASDGGTDTPPSGFPGTAYKVTLPIDASIYLAISGHTVGQPAINTLWIKGSVPTTIGFRYPGSAVINNKSVSVVTAWQKIDAVTISAEATGRILLDNRVSQGFGTSSVVVTVFAPMSTNSAFVLPCVPPTQSSASAAATSSDNGAKIPMSDAVISALEGGTGTVAGEFTVGATSASITAPVSLITCKNTESGMMFLDTGGTLKSTDGTNTASVTIAGGVAIGDVIRGIVECGGGKFRVGYIKNTETSITWSAATLAEGTTFAGTFAPLEYLRPGYLNTIPLWYRGLHVWQRSGLTFDEITDPLEIAS